MFQFQISQSQLKYCIYSAMTPFSKLFFQNHTDWLSVSVSKSLHFCTCKLSRAHYGHHHLLLDLLNRRRSRVILNVTRVVSLKTQLISKKLKLSCWDWCCGWPGCGACCCCWGDWVICWCWLKMFMLGMPHLSGWPPTEIGTSVTSPFISFSFSIWAEWVSKKNDRLLFQFYLS